MPLKWWADYTPLRLLGLEPAELSTERMIARGGEGGGFALLTVPASANL